MKHLALIISILAFGSFSWACGEKASNASTDTVTTAATQAPTSEIMSKINDSSSDQQQEEETSSN